LARKFYNYQVDQYKEQAAKVFQDEYEKKLHQDILTETNTQTSTRLNPAGEKLFIKTPEQAALDILVNQECELSKRLRYDFTRARLFNLLPQDQFANGATPASIIGELGRIKIEDVQPLLGRQNSATMAIVMSEMLMQNTEEELAPIDPSRVKSIRTMNGFLYRKFAGAKLEIGKIPDKVDTVAQVNNPFSSKLEKDSPAKPPMFKLPAKEKLLMLPTETVEELVSKTLYYIPKGRIDKAVKKLSDEMLKRGDVYMENPEGTTDKSDAKYRFTSNMTEDPADPNAQSMPPKPLPDYARNILQKELKEYWDSL
jgi:hypothetical protein